MKLDAKKSMDSYRARRGEFRFLDVPPLAYLMIDGHGDPNTTPQYAEAIATLYPLAYATKFASKRRLGRDYVVPPLKALWWAEDMDAFTTRRDKRHHRSPGDVVAECDLVLALVADLIGGAAEVVREM